MKELRAVLRFCGFPMLLAMCLTCLTCLLDTGVARAATLSISGDSLFSSLDGSAQDADGLADGVLTVDGNLDLSGTIRCNDDPPVPAGAGACPIRIAVSGDMVIEAGGAILAENRRGRGDGGEIRLDVGGGLTLQGPDGALPGAIVSSSRLNGTVGSAGDIAATAGGPVNLEAGSVVAASSVGGSAGTVAVTAGASLRVAGLVAAGGTRTVLASRFSGPVLDLGNSGQTGGPILLRAGGSEEPALTIEPDGIVVSQGEGGGARLVMLEACGIEVRGIVASVSKDLGPSQVALRSGRGILVDGRDLGSSTPGGTRLGRVRADSTQQGAAGYVVDLFATSDIAVLGPDPTATDLFAVSSTPGTQPLRSAGGTVTAISLAGTLTAAGNAVETGRSVTGDQGGTIDLEARGDVALDGATMRAIGDFSSTSSSRAGGHLSVRSFQGGLSWTFGVGDVRPTGTGVGAANSGTIELTACTTVDTTGSQFPVNGAAVPPFPVETEGVCSPAAPSLPEGEPPLPDCTFNQPPVVDPATFTLAENSANGTVVGTVTFTDPDAGQGHTFSITAGNTGGAFAIDASGQITVASSAALDFETTPTFALTVEVTDDGTPPLSGSATVTVNLTDVNEPPMPAGGPFSVAENSPVGTVVGTVAANDPDSGQSHTFSITAGNTNGAFAIDAAGQITVASATALDFETTPTFTLTVEVTDSGSPALSGTASVVIHVTDQPEPPVAHDDSFEAVGNTLLEVHTAPSAPGPKIAVTGTLLTNDSDPDAATTLTASLNSASPGAVVTVAADGTFTYLPPAGATGSDTFIYNLSDGTFTTTGTVTIHLVHRIWFVRNDAAAGGLGRSADPFDTLTEAQTASAAGDTIYVFAGSGTTAGQSAGIVLKANQRLIGEGVALVVPATVNGVANPTLRAAGSRPQIDNTAGGNGVSATNAGSVVIRGLDIAGDANAVDITTSGTDGGGATIADNVISGAGAEGIDVNGGGTGTLTVAIHDNAVTAAGNGIDVQRTAGALVITALDDNTVSGDTGGAGIVVTGPASFDAVPGGAVDMVSGGATVIGASGNGVGGSGVVLTGVSGNLFFSDLDVFADGGVGVRVSGTGSTSFGVSPGVAIIEANGGPAVDVSSVAFDLQLTSLKSTNSATTGVALNSITGTFSAGFGSSISGITSASGTAFQVGNSNATITYDGTITTTTGSGVVLTGNAGSTIGFTGTLALSTGGNPAFAATGGGTVTATNTASTLATTTGIALNVANTTIGAGGLKFQSISAGTAASGPTSGIVLNNTGSSGSLTVSGTG